MHMVRRHTKFHLGLPKLNNDNVGPLLVGFNIGNDLVRIVSPEDTLKFLPTGWKTNVQCKTQRSRFNKLTKEYMWKIKIYKRPSINMLPKVVKLNVYISIKIVPGSELTETAH